MKPAIPCTLYVVYIERTIISCSNYYIDETAQSLTHHLGDSRTSLGVHFSILASLHDGMASTVKNAALLDFERAPFRLEEVLVPPEPGITDAGKFPLLVDWVANDDSS